MTDKTQALLPVTPEARKAALDLMDEIGRVRADLYGPAILRGEWDECDELQAFARFERDIIASQSRSLPGDVGMRSAVERFLADYDDGDRADAGVHPLMEAHIADFRAALAHPAQATPSAVSGDAGEVETTVAAIVAHLRTRAGGFRAAAKKQGKRVGPMAKGFDWAALEIESTFAALPSHQGAG